MSIKHNYWLRSEAELPIFQLIEIWCYRKRLYSSLGYKSIEEFKVEMFNQKVAA